MLKTGKGHTCVFKQVKKQVYQQMRSAGTPSIASLPHAAVAQHMDTIKQAGRQRSLQCYSLQVRH
jgi:hypothetical protein